MKGFSEKLSQHLNILGKLTLKLHNIKITTCHIHEYMYIFDSCNYTMSKVH